MKNLNNLNNVERAKLLITLFPEHKLEICRACIDVLNEINLNVQTLKDSWNVPLMTFEMWRNLGNEVSKIIIKYDGGERLKTPSLFSDQLFDGYLSLFTWHCVRVAMERIKDEKFTHMVNVLN